MRRRHLTLTFAVFFALPATAGAATTGGASAPGLAGGAQYGQPVAPSPTPRPRVARFFVTPPRVRPGGRAVRFVYQVSGRSGSVDVRIDLVRIAGRRSTTRLRLGRHRTGVRLDHRWAPKAGAIRPGRYLARLHAVDPEGRVLARSARASGRLRLRISAPVAPPAPVTPAPPTPPAGNPVPAPTAAGVFPVRGPWSFGGAGSGFGAARDGHVHQGQDIVAAEGTPVVAVRAGVISWRAYQAGGAGHYLVLHGDDGRDYVFMHLRDGSLLVTKGSAVAAGQQIAQVGSTGASSGPHLHFEIWPNGWYASKASHPIDPLPDLQAWAGQV
jgi:hypothetical protein